jgi:hypothetical protein
MPLFARSAAARPCSSLQKNTTAHAGLRVVTRRPLRRRRSQCAFLAESDSRRPRTSEARRRECAGVEGRSPEGRSGVALERSTVARRFKSSDGGTGRFAGQRRWSLSWKLPTAGRTHARACPGIAAPDTNAWFRVRRMVCGHVHRALRLPAEHPVHPEADERQNDQFRQADAEGHGNLSIEIGLCAGSDRICDDSPLKRYESWRRRARRSDRWLILAYAIGRHQGRLDLVAWDACAAHEATLTAG